jgi:hypothetical protein
VGTCYAGKLQIENEDNGNPTDNNDLDLNIMIVNAYPSYNCIVTFEVRNMGTIPVSGPHIATDGNFNSWNGTCVMCVGNFTEDNYRPRRECLVRDKLPCATSCRGESYIVVRSI